VILILRRLGGKPSVWVPGVVCLVTKFSDKPEFVEQHDNHDLVKKEAWL
jgi:hypothetical protein